jgi:hypothetical protein
MASPAPVLSFGALEEQIGGLKFSLRKNDFDACSYSIDSASDGFVEVGDALPGYAKMKAVDVRQEQVGDVWVYNSEFKGFKNPLETLRVFARSENSPSEGFDNVSLTIATTMDTTHPLLARGAGIPNDDSFPYMFIVDRTKEVSEVAGFNILNLQLRGMLGDKPMTRRVNGNQVTIQPSVSWEMANQTNAIGETVTGWPGFSYPNTEFTIPKITVVDSFITTTTPPWGGIPGNFTPEDAPTLTDFVFWTSGAVRYNWPFGWRRANVTSEQIPGKDLWFVSVTYEYQHKILPE